MMVPGGGIEPPTRGFSIHCSTPELPRHRGRFSPSGLRVLGQVPGGVQCEIAAISVLAFGGHFGLARGFFKVFGTLGRDRVAA